MKPDAHKQLEPFRIATGRLASDASLGNNGAFMLPLFKHADEIMLGMFEHFTVSVGVVVSDGDGWDHVSVSLTNRCPTWEEMAFIKDLFFEPHEAVMQLHPPHSEYVNHHPFCLHLWRPHNRRIPLPPTYMVGPKKTETV